MSDCFTGRMREEIPPALIAFGDAFLDKEHLKELNLSDNAFGPAGAEPLQKLLETNTNIQILKLNNNGLGVQGGNYIASALLKAQEKNVKNGKTSSLQTIIAGRNRLENGSMDKLSEAFAAHGTLKTICLPQNGIRPEGITMLLERLTQCKDLECLDLQDNTFTDAGSEALAKALPEWTKLKTLNVGDCLLGNKGGKAIATALMSGFEHLETINLTYGEIEELSALELAKCISKLPNLKHLELNGNSFSSSGKAVTAIQEALEDNNKDEDVLGSLSDMDYDSDEEDEEDEDVSDNDENVDNLASKINEKLNI